MAGPGPGAVVATVVRWPARRWSTAVAATLALTLVVAVPTDLVDTPLFQRQIPAPWWAWPALLVSTVLGGLLTATYVASPAGTSPAGASAEGPAATRGGWAGGLLTYFAVGCPVCNKLVLLALGATGAVQWFEPVQPLLQLLAVVLLGWALWVRLAGEVACPVVPPREVADV